MLAIVCVMCNVKASKDFINYLPKNAVGDIIPVRLATKIAVPDSKKGEVKSTAASRSALTLSDVRTMSNFLDTSSPIRPFHFPFCEKKKKNTSHLKELIFWSFVCHPF